MIDMISTIRAMATSSSTIVKPCRRRIGISQSGEPLKQVGQTFLSALSARQTRMSAPPSTGSVTLSLERLQLKHLDDVIHDDRDTRDVRAWGGQPCLHLDIHGVRGGGVLVDTDDPVEAPMRGLGHRGIEEPAPDRDVGRVPGTPTKSD